MNPYILQNQPMQELSGLQPVFQNFGQQQLNQQAALAQQMGNTQQAGMVGQQDGSMNGMAMAAMLRKKDENKPAPVYDYSTPMPQYLDPAYMQAGY